MIRRRALRPVAGVCVLLLLTACIGSETDPAATAAQTTPATVTMADPVEFVLAFNEHVLNENWGVVRSMLVEDFRRFDGEMLSQGLGLRMPSDLGQKAGDWVVEQHERFTAVRISDLPVIAIVLRDGENGGWLVDPGPHRLAMAKLRADGFTNWGGSTFQYDRAGLAEQDLVTFSRYLHEHVEHVDINNADVDVTVGWMFDRGATGEFPIENVSWSAADESGPVEVAWATAKIDDGLLTFPQPEADEGSPSYEATLTLHGVPDAVELELHFDHMRLIAPGLDDGDFSTTIHIPLETYPQPAKVDVSANMSTPAG